MKTLLMLALAVSGVAGAATAELLDLTYAYDAMGRLVSVTYGDSATTTYTYDAMSNIVAIDTVSGTLSSDPGATDPAQVPDVFALAPVAPNPSRNAPVIRFQLPEETRVRVRIFDPAGRVVRTVHDGRLEAGRHARPWDRRDDAGRTVSEGIYLYRLEAGSFTATRKLVILGDGS